MHLFATFFTGWINLQPYGHAWTQYLHPIQYFSSIRTTPSGLSYVAPTGHTWVHGDFEQWLHIFGTKYDLKISSVGTLCSKPSIPPFGDTISTVPSFLTVYCSIQVRKKNGSLGTSFSLLQALAQDPHPIHFWMSITIPYHGRVSSFGSAANSRTCDDFSHEYPIVAPARSVAVLRNFLRDVFIFSVPMVDVDCDILCNSSLYYVLQDQSEILHSSASLHSESDTCRKMPSLMALRYLPFYCWVNVSLQVHDKFHSVFHCEHPVLSCLQYPDDI